MKRRSGVQPGTPAQAWAQFDTQEDLRRYTNRSRKRKRLAAKLVWLRLNGSS